MLTNRKRLSCAKVLRKFRSKLSLSSHRLRQSSSNRHWRRRGLKRDAAGENNLELLPDKDHKKLPLLVAHTHRHLDHRAGDPQFASLPSVQTVPIDSEGVRAFFGFTDWPNGISHLDLGDRIVDVIPTPGHNPTHVAFYDNRTGILFSGDFLLPGRLLIEDAAATVKAPCGLSTF